MNLRKSRGVALIFVALSSIACFACAKRTFEYAFEVTRGATVNERLANAKAILTDSRLVTLKSELKRQFPGLTDTELQRFGYRCGTEWPLSGGEETSGPRVTCFVMMQEQTGIDAEAVVERAAKTLETEVNGERRSPVDVPIGSAKFR